MKNVIRVAFAALTTLPLIACEGSIIEGLPEALQGQCTPYAIGDTCPHDIRDSVAAEELLGATGVCLPGHDFRLHLVGPDTVQYVCFYGGGPSDYYLGGGFSPALGYSFLERDGGLVFCRDGRVTDVLPMVRLLDGRLFHLTVFDDCLEQDLCEIVDFCE